MAIAGTAGAAIVEQIGGADRRLILRNGEIERFEAQYAPFGIFDLMACFAGGAAHQAQARHCRDLLALALVGGGMSDVAADALVASMPPPKNRLIMGLAAKVLFAAFTDIEVEVVGEEKKTADGSPAAAAEAADTMPLHASATSSG